MKLFVGDIFMTYIKSKITALTGQVDALNAQNIFTAGGQLNGTPWYASGAHSKSGTGILIGTSSTITGITIDGAAKGGTDASGTGGPSPYSAYFNGGGQLWCLPYASSLGIAGTGTSWGITTSSAVNGFGTVNRPIKVATVSRGVGWPNTGYRETILTVAGPGILRTVECNVSRSNNQNGSTDYSGGYEILINSSETANVDKSIVSWGFSWNGNGSPGAITCASLFLPFNGTLKIRVYSHTGWENAQPNTLLQYTYHN